MDKVYTQAKLPSLSRFFQLLRLEKKDISAIYFFAILASLVQLSLPLGFQAIIGFVQGGMVSTSLVLLVAFIVIGVFLNGWLQVNQMKVIEKIQQQFFVRYAMQYAHILPRLKLKSTEKYYLPELVNRFFDTVSLQKGLSKILLDIPAALLQVLFGIVLLSLYNPLFMILGLSLLGLIVLIIKFTAQKGMATSLDESNHKYAVAGWLEEIARSLLSFKMLGGLSFPLKQTDKRLVSYLESRTAHFKVLLFQYWILVFFKVIVSAGLVIMGVFLLINQQLNIGQFVAAEIIVLLLISSVEKLIGYMDKVYDVITSFEKLAKLGDLPSEEGRSFNKEAIMTNQQWEFEVKQLGFGHDGRSSLFSGIDFRVQTGMTLGIKGGNGSGKSSLLKVLAGLYHPTDGSILLNGLPLSSYELLDYKENIGFCVDQPELIEGSLRDNVVMGREGIGEDAISKLTLALNLEPLLNSIPEKWDYKVHAAGKALPKKLKQKLMLMRSLVHQPRLVLLDEPWHGLDQNSQINMRNCILNYSKEAIVIVTSNDPVFLEKCNLVIDLESF